MNRRIKKSPRKAIVEETPEIIPQAIQPSKPNILNPVLVLLLLVGSFFLGSLYTKVQYLEQNQTTSAQAVTGQQTTPSVPNKPQPLHVAKAIGIDPQKFNSCLTSHKYAKQVGDDVSYGQIVGVNSTPTTFINGQIIVGAQPYSFFKTIIDQEINQPNYPLTTGSRTNVEGGPFSGIGNDNAPVTIIEFADFQCPFCERFFTQTESSIMNDYVKTGKVKFIFRNFSFLGPESTTAAEGAYCANEQGKFWEYHNFLYQHQGQENSGTFSETNLQ